MSKPKDLPLSNRIARKTIPIGAKAAWWYLERNGDITIYGTSFKGEPFSCAIKRRGLKSLRRSLEGAER